MISQYFRGDIKTFSISRGVTRAGFVSPLSSPAAPSEPQRYWEIIADKFNKAGWSWGCVSGVDSLGRTTFIGDAHRGGNRRFIVSADEKLAAFVELESAVRAAALDSIQV